MAEIVAVLAFPAIVLSLMIVAAQALRRHERPGTADTARRRLVLDLDETRVTVDLDAVGADDPREVERAIRAARRNASARRPTLAAR
ncbi:hypothetical protein [Salinarimonas ramus]|uniref:Uncharacterized protein n=1 Tax=Salinarimonas ramus TaxID=690164 RepID=A0A917V3N5_9HYPH|nr:hypothetical protein [Salinarimonas ramus]GGK32334.1 hypothetical protein GCM10011322_18800 [Salinarimonas ramus]